MMITADRSQLGCAAQGPMKDAEAVCITVSEAGDRLKRQSSHTRLVHIQARLPKNSSIKPLSLSFPPLPYNCPGLH